MSGLEAQAVCELHVEWVYIEHGCCGEIDSGSPSIAPDWLARAPHVEASYTALADAMRLRRWFGPRDDSVTAKILVGPGEWPASSFFDGHSSAAKTPMCVAPERLQFVCWLTNHVHVADETDMPPVLVLDSTLPPEFHNCEEDFEPFRTQSRMSAFLGKKGARTARVRAPS